MTKHLLPAIIVIALSMLSCKPKIIGTVREKNAADSISFIVIGDWGVRGSAVQKRVADQVDKVSRINNVQFIITTGDNFYPAGVTSVNHPHWQNSFEKVYNKAGHMIPWYPVLGNHDYYGSPAAEIQYSKISNRWKFPSTYYSSSRTVGKSSIVFAFADTNPFISGYYYKSMPELKLQDTAAQFKWLQGTLSSKADWKIMIGHHPLYTYGGYGSNTELVNRFKSLLLQTGTQFYLAGHDHNLQHIKLANEPVNYLVSGGGGRKLYALQARNANAQFAVATHGFLLMTFYEDHCNFYFYNDTGRLLYQQHVLRE